MIKFDDMYRMIEDMKKINVKAIILKADMCTAKLMSHVDTALVYFESCRDSFAVIDIEELYKTMLRLEYAINDLYEDDDRLVECKFVDGEKDTIRIQLKLTTLDTPVYYSIKCIDKKSK